MTTIIDPEHEIEHWLFSVVLGAPAKTHFYGYVMGNEEDVKAGCGRLTRICEAIGRTYEIDIGPTDIAVTMLDAEGVRLVREVVSASRHCREGFKAATDFHISAWVMPDEDPRAGRLLALHDEAA
jgi:hypothetical protein